MGRPSRYRVAKSSRSSMRATVVRAESRSISAVPIVVSHSELRRISSRSGQRSRLQLVRRRRRWSSISSAARDGRVVVRPVGSPTWAVKSPRIRTATCPRSWNWRSLRSTTANPRWMSDAVGSIPSLTRSGVPRASLWVRSASVITSTAPVPRTRSCSAGASIQRTYQEGRAAVGATARTSRCQVVAGQTQVGVTGHVPAPAGAVASAGTQADPARSARPTRWRDPVVEDPQWPAPQIRSVVGTRDGERLGQPGWTRAQVTITDPRAGAGCGSGRCRRSPRPGRSRTADATPSTPATTFAHQCMP